MYKIYPLSEEMDGWFTGNLSPKKTSKVIMDLSANATTTILGRAQAAKTAQAVVSPDSPEWLNTDADHYRNPTVEQFKRILEDMRGKANYDALAKLKLLSIGSAPHPVMPWKTMATLDFEDSFELPKELRGKRLYLANVFLTDAQLAFFKENYGESNSKDANEKNPQFWTDAKKPNGQLFGNLEAFQSSFVRQIWGMLPDENSKWGNEWIKILSAIPGTTDEKAKLLNMPYAGYYEEDANKYTYVWVSATVWSGSKSSFAYFHRENDSSFVFWDGSGRAMNARTWVKKEQK